MIRNIKITLLLFLIILLVSECSEQKGAIVRHDIKSEELNIFYEGIKPQEIEYALGLPHLARSDRNKALYYYNIIGGYLEVYFYSGPVYVGNKVILYNEVIQTSPYMESSQDNRGKIEKNKYLMDIREDIDLDELDFISGQTSSKQLQDALGAPQSYELYKQGEMGSVDEIVTNAFIYDLKGDDILKVTYFDSGEVFKVWIEDKEGAVVRVFVDMSE